MYITPLIVLSIGQGWTIWTTCNKLLTTVMFILKAIFLSLIDIKLNWYTGIPGGVDNFYSKTQFFFQFHSCLGWPSIVGYSEHVYNELKRSDFHFPWLYCSKLDRYNELCLQRSKIVRPWHYVISVFHCTSIYSMPFIFLGATSVY